MGELIQFSGITCVPEPPEGVLEKAKSWGMDRCLVLGFTEDNETRFGGSFSQLGDMLILLELAKRNLLARL